MKKLLALLLALSVAGSLFAFDLGNGLTVAGAVKTGVRVYGWAQEDNPASEAGDGTAVILPFNRDAGHPFRVETTFTYNNGNSGFTYRFRAQINNAFNGSQGTANSGGFELLIPFAYGWMGFGNGPDGSLVELSGGILDNKKWGTMDGFDLDAGIDNDGYLKIAVKPLKGLSFGINTVTAWPQQLAAITGTKSEAGPKDDAHALTDLRPFWTTALGARYQADIIDATLSARFNKKDGAGIYAAADDKYFELLGYAKIAAIQSLPIYFDFRVRTEDWNSPTDTGKNKKNSDLQIGLQPRFTISDALELRLRAQFKNEEKKNANGIDTSIDNGVWALEFRPAVIYKINNQITLDAELGLQFADNKYTIGDNKAYDDYKWKGGFALDLYPKLIFDFGNGAKLDARYRLRAAGLSKGNMDEAWKDAGYQDFDGVEAPKTYYDHNIYLDLIWSF